VTQSLAAYTRVEDFESFGVRALISTRAAGDLALAGTGPVRDVLARWQQLRAALGAAGPDSRFATSTQVHGSRVVIHRPGWSGWLRAGDADGHVAVERGTGLGVTIADCVPVFLAHPSGAVGMIHAGWRGTAARILPAAIGDFQTQKLAPADLKVHLGPAICGKCYEVGPDVYAQLTGSKPAASRKVDLRQVLAEQARAAGVHSITISESCTLCDNALYFSHRGGDAGRQVAAILAPAHGQRP
jgi:YfiH family protein